MEILHFPEMNSKIFTYFKKWDFIQLDKRV